MLPDIITYVGHWRLRQLKWFGREKFAFGSHSPIRDYMTGLLRIESMNTSEADEGIRELLRSGNAGRIPGI